MTDDYTPTWGNVRLHAIRDIRALNGLSFKDAVDYVDRAIAAHDTELRAEIAREIRAHEFIKVVAAKVVRGTPEYTKALEAAATIAEGTR